MRVLVVAADATERRVLALQTDLWGAPSSAANVAEALALVQTDSHSTSPSSSTGARPSTAWRSRSP